MLFRSGVKYSVMVNSGASANDISMKIVKEKYGNGEVIVPPLTWVSDISSVMNSGLTPVFVDIDAKTLGISTDAILAAITSRTRAVFITHVLGINALSTKLLTELKKKKIALIEDVCESHGAKFKNKKVGTYGLISNFSFYYAHHLSTIEGGMVCTNSRKIYELVKILRSHGMVRESGNKKYEKNIINSDLDSLIVDYSTWMDEVINSSNESFITEAGDIEKWVGSSKKKLLENKEETIKYLQSLKK